MGCKCSTAVLRQQPAIETVTTSAGGEDPLSLVPDTAPFKQDYEYEGVLLGKGSFGNVYRGRHKRTREEVAIKVMERGKIKATSIHREYNVLEHLGHHRYIVDYKGTYKTKEQVAFVLELMEGGELFDRLIKHGAVPEAEARLQFARLAQALRYLHSRGIVHRDLKPENVLLKTKFDPNDPDSRPVWKLSDFGLSQLLGPNERLLKVCGTWAYAAPEMSDPARQGYDCRFDCFSFGVIAYVALSGSHPFDTLGTAPVPEIKARARAAKFDYDGEEWLQISDRAKDFIRRLIVKNPEERLDSEAMCRHPWFCDIVEPMHSIPLSSCSVPALGHPGSSARSGLSPLTVLPPSALSPVTPASAPVVVYSSGKAGAARNHPSSAAGSSSAVTSSGMRVDGVINPASAAGMAAAAAAAAGAGAGIPAVADSPRSVAARLSRHDAGVTSPMSPDKTDPLSEHYEPDWAGMAEYLPNFTTVDLPGAGGRPTAEPRNGSRSTPAAGGGGGVVSPGSAVAFSPSTTRAQSASSRMLAPALGVGPLTQASHRAGAALALGTAASFPTHYLRDSAGRTVTVSDIGPSYYGQHSAAAETSASRMSGDAQPATHGYATSGSSAAPHAEHRVAGGSHGVDRSYSNSYAGAGGGDASGGWERDDSLAPATRAMPSVSAVQALAMPTGAPPVLIPLPADASRNLGRLTSKSGGSTTPHAVHTAAGTSHVAAAGSATNSTPGSSPKQTSPMNFAVGRTGRPYGVLAVGDAAHGGGGGGGEAAGPTMGSGKGMGQGAADPHSQPWFAPQRGAAELPSDRSSHSRQSRSGGAGKSSAPADGAFSLGPGGGVSDGLGARSQGGPAPASGSGGGSGYYGGGRSVPHSPGSAGVTVHADGLLQLDLPAEGAVQLQHAAGTTFTVVTSPDGKVFLVPTTPSTSAAAAAVGTSGSAGAQQAVLQGSQRSSLQPGGHFAFADAGGSAAAAQAPRAAPGGGTARSYGAGSTSARSSLISPMAVHMTLGSPASVASMASSRGRGNGRPGARGQQAADDSELPSHQHEASGVSRGRVASGAQAAAGSDSSRSSASHTSSVKDGSPLFLPLMDSRGRVVGRMPVSPSTPQQHPAVTSASAAPAERPAAPGGSSARADGAPRRSATHVPGGGDLSDESPVASHAASGRNGSGPGMSPVGSETSVSAVLSAAGGVPAPGMSPMPPARAAALLPVGGGGGAAALNGAGGAGSHAAPDVLHAHHSFTGVEATSFREAERDHEHEQHSQFSPTASASARDHMQEYSGSDRAVSEFSPTASMPQRQRVYSGASQISSSGVVLNSVPSMQSVVSPSPGPRERGSRDIDRRVSNTSGRLYRQQGLAAEDGPDKDVVWEMPMSAVPARRSLSGQSAVATLGGLGTLTSMHTRPSLGSGGGSAAGTPMARIGAVSETAAGAPPFQVMVMRQHSSKAMTPSVGHTPHDSGSEGAAKTPSYPPAGLRVVDRGSAAWASARSGSVGVGPHLGSPGGSVGAAAAGPAAAAPIPFSKKPQLVVANSAGGYSLAQATAGAGSADASGRSGSSGPASPQRSAV